MEPVDTTRRVTDHLFNTQVDTGDVHIMLKLHGMIEEVTMVTAKRNVAQDFSSIKPTLFEKLKVVSGAQDVDGDMVPVEWSTRYEDLFNTARFKIVQTQTEDLILGKTECERVEAVFRGLIDRQNLILFRYDGKKNAEKEKASQMEKLQEAREVLEAMSAQIAKQRDGQKKNDDKKKDDHGSTEA